MIYRKVTERGHRNPMLPNSSILAGMPCKCITKIVVRSIQNMLRFIYHTFNHTFTYHLIHVENTLRIKFGISYLTFNQIDRGQLLYLNIYIYIYIYIYYLSILLNIVHKWVTLLNVTCYIHLVPKTFMILSLIILSQISINS